MQIQNLWHGWKKNPNETIYNDEKWKQFNQWAKKVNKIGFFSRKHFNYVFIDCQRWCWRCLNRELTVKNSYGADKVLNKNRSRSFQLTMQRSYYRERNVCKKKTQNELLALKTNRKSQFILCKCFFYFFIIEAHR